MNERLKELLPNPFVVDYQEPGGGRHGFDLYDEKRMIEYGSRIVRECAVLATSEYDARGAVHGDDLLKHFGVEE